MNVCHLPCTAACRLLGQPLWQQHLGANRLFDMDNVSTAALELVELTAESGKGCRRAAASAGRTTTHTHYKQATHSHVGLQLACRPAAALLNGGIVL
jgi:hypothetical protein